jgi:hypothetical protein
MPTPPTHERLVARLIADAPAVRPLWSPHTRLALWLVLQALMLGVAVQFGLRQDLRDHFRHPLFLLELGVLVAAGTMAAALALRAAVPGMASGRVAVTVSVLLVSAAVVFMSLESARTGGSARGFVATGGQCLVCILGFSAIPWTVLFLAVRRGAPLAGPVAGAYAGAASVLFAATAVRIACPIDEELHVLAWHTMPIAMGAALSSVAGGKWLIWNDRRQGPAVSHRWGRRVAVVGR